ncbi:unnamed protein product [Caenorhabditis brenneri]
MEEIIPLPDGRMLVLSPYDEEEMRKSHELQARKVEKYIEDSKLENNYMMFNIDDEATSDVCLIVGDRKFYCSKRHLSLHSPHFRAMFFGESAEQNKEIVLNEPSNADDFHLFLLIINGVQPFGDRTEQSFFEVMALSEKWKAMTAYEFCFDYCLKSNKTDIKQKYGFADLFKLDEYKVKLVSNIETKEDLLMLSGVIDHNTLTETIKDKLLLKSLQLHGIRCRPPCPPEHAIKRHGPLQLNSHRLLDYIRTAYSHSQFYNEEFLRQSKEMREEQLPHRDPHCFDALHLQMTCGLGKQTDILKEFLALERDHNAEIPRNTRELLHNVEVFFKNPNPDQTMYEWIVPIMRRLNGINFFPQELCSKNWLPV